MLFRSPATQPEQEAPVEEPVVSPLAREEAAQEAIIPPSEFQMRSDELDQVQKDIRDLKQAKEEQSPEIVNQDEDIGTVAAAATAPQVEEPAPEPVVTPEKTVTPEPVAAPEIRQEHIDAATEIAKILRKQIDSKKSIMPTVPPLLRTAAKNLGVYDKTLSPTDMLSAVETKLSEIKQGVPNGAAETIESGRPAAGATSAVGSGGDGSGVGDTTESAVANGTPLGSAGDNAVNAVSGAGKTNAALVGQPLEPTDVHEGETDVEALKARLKDLNDSLKAGEFGNAGIDYENALSERKEVRNKLTELGVKKPSLAPTKAVETVTPSTDEIGRAHV